ncbi:MAG: polysaccharide biosynthesis/export family protein [Bacteroidetes bacterium]|nr:polysaccharide biosynthesis/export family protein [Bacteroidota bacterium]
MKYLRKASPVCLLFFCMIVLVLPSCVPHKNILYIQRIAKDTTRQKEYVNSLSHDYKIQPNDNLYIKISSLNEKTAPLFNKQTGASELSSDATIYLNSYSVNEEGYIDLPSLGKIIVTNLTVTEIRDLLQSRIDEYLKQSTITVKLVNFNITIVGEVNHTGQFKIYQDRINIFEALSIAGDVSDFADRRHIALVRQYKNGSTIHYLDVTSDKILSSEYYYLMPNDILYVAPLAVKRFGFTQFPYSILFSAITTMTTLILLIYTLKK